MSKDQMRVEKWDARLTFFWKFLIVTGLITILVTTGFVVVTVTQVQRISEQNNDLNRETVRISQRLIDCTTPGYQCYEESRAETGRAVLTLNTVTKAAVICADQPGVITETEMESCIKKQLGK